MLWKARYDFVELTLLAISLCPVLKIRKLTISTLVIADVISSQQPQFMGKRWTLFRNQAIASSVFFSLARTMP